MKRLMRSIHSLSQSRLGDIAAAAMLLAAATGLWFIVSPKTHGDPDRFYHHEISARFATEGIIKTIPQLPVIGWDKYYPDKEFLFHLVLSIGHRLGGEPGGEAAMLAMVLFTFFSIWLLARHFLGPFLGAATLGMLLLGNGLITYRLFMLRPHVFAAGILALTLFMIIKRRPWSVTLCCAAFALAYHALFVVAIPLAAVATLWFAGGERPLIRQTLLHAGLGILIGILANPYFPSNIDVMIQLIRISTTSGYDIPRHMFGAESLPIATDAFMPMAAQCLYMLALCLFLLGRSDRRRFQDWDYGMFAAMTLALAAFTGLAFLNPRAMEYWLPLGLIPLGFCLRSMSKKHLSLNLAALAVLGFLSLNNSLATFIFKPAEPDKNWQELRQALAVIPVAKPLRSQRLFHEDWGHGAFLLRERPDLEIIDLLDPSFLVKHEKELGEAKRLFSEQGDGDAYTLVREMFGSDWYLQTSMPPAAVINDPNFDMAYPSKSEIHWNAFIFKVARDRHPGSILSYSVRAASRDFLPGEAVTPSAFTADFRPWPEADSQAAIHRLPFVDLVSFFRHGEENEGKADSGGTSLSAKAAGDRLTCGLMRVNHQALGTGKTLTTLLFGGGPYVKVFLDDRPLFANADPNPFPRAYKWSLSLDRPLTPDSLLEVAVCRRRDDIHLSFVSVLMTDSEHRTYCSQGRGIESDYRFRDQKALLTEITPSACRSILPAFPRPASAVAVPSGENAH